MVTRRLVVQLGVAQLICWGTSYYAIGVLGEPMALDLGLSATVTHGGFSLALVVMGLSSPAVGRWIDRHGGRPVMVAGSCLSALACVGLSVAHGLVVYGLAWALLGLAMRMTLYEAAFAALVRIAGPDAKQPISQLTLLGGLASTAFWPIGHALAGALGWRGAFLAYAAITLTTLPLHLAIPSGRYERAGQSSHVERKPLAVTKGERILATTCYVLLATFTMSLNTGFSAHMIAILVGLGMGTSAAVWTSTLRGVGQSSARACEVLFGETMSPITLGVLATSVLPVCFLAGLLSGRSEGAAVVFALVFGAGNGLATIVRGTLPLVLFDTRHYGSTVGRLLLPSFLVSALAPLAYAWVIDRWGEGAALYLSTAIGAVLLAASASLLPLRARDRARAALASSGCGSMRR